ncbi:MAG: nicotinate-nucleotide adenylyltransferase [Chamaesiphon sp.]
MDCMRKIAILGGTFDPVRWGHMLMAETALTVMALDMAIWVPDRGRVGKRAARLEHRRAMVQQAIADNPDFVLLSVERDPNSPDYAIETLLNLQNIYPNSRWYWILGLDAFQTLPRWYRRQDLIPACEWLVAPRLMPIAGDVAQQEKLDPHIPDVGKKETGTLFASSQGFPSAATCYDINFLCQKVAQHLAAQKIPIRWQLLQMPSVGISSSLIRRYCQVRRSIRYLVPEAVQIYIATHNLYTD